MSPLSLQMLVSTRNLEKINFVLNQITKSSIGKDAHRGRREGAHQIKFKKNFLFQKCSKIQLPRFFHNPTYPPQKNLSKNPLKGMRYEYRFCSSYETKDSVQLINVYFLSKGRKKDIKMAKQRKEGFGLFLSNGHSPQIRENGELLMRMCQGESHFSQKWPLANVGESGEYLPSLGP
jgi:hypothetical protein